MAALGLRLWHAGSVAVVHGLSCPMAYGILVPQPGREPGPPALEGRFLTTGPPGKSPESKFFSNKSMVTVLDVSLGSSSGLTVLRFISRHLLQVSWSLELGQGHDFTCSFHFHALEKEMATHSGVLAWRIPGMGETGGLPSMGSHRVGHD